MVNTRSALVVLAEMVTVTVLLPEPLEGEKLIPVGDPVNFQGQPAGAEIPTLNDWRALPISPSSEPNEPERCCSWREQGAAVPAAWVMVTRLPAMVMFTARL